MEKYFMKEWLPISEAASKLGVSDRGLYYRIEKGKVESKVEDGKRFVLIDASENISEQPSEATSEVFQKLIEEKDARIVELADQLEKVTSLLALSEKNVGVLSEQNQFLLEDNYHKPSFWQRLKARFAQN
jgi:hypothetical protein